MWSILVSTALAGTLDLDPWDLVRVDDPEHPDALLRSARGSVLAAPPAEGAWRVEAVPENDRVERSDRAGRVALSAEVPSRALAPDEALEAMAIGPWHQAGIDGSRGGNPVRVAIFDSQWEGLGAALSEGRLQTTGGVSTHDCHAHLSCAPPIDDLQPAFSWESGGHGLACAEVLSTVAPGVRLYLVRVSSQTALENAVAWARREGIELVSMSLSFFNGSFYDGTGDLAELMGELHDGGALMVTSAGNYATQHWAGPFRDTDGDGAHEFSADWPRLPVYLGAGSYRFMVSWDDFARCGRTDLDAFVYDDAGLLVGRSERRQVEGEAGCEPVERVRVTMQAAGWAWLELRRVAGAADVRVDVLARGGRVWEPVAAGSVADPGTSASVLTVGAVQAEGYATNPAESFSSQGPTHAGLPKPDLTGPDGLSTSVYGPLGFFGTSASTPAVTGALALLMHASPTLRPAEAARRLREHTLAEGVVWTEADPALGAGKVRLASPSGAPASCATLPGPAALLLLPLAIRRRRPLQGATMVDEARHGAAPRSPRQAPT